MNRVPLLLMSLGIGLMGRSEDVNASPEPMTLEACKAYASRQAPDLALQRLSFTNLVEAVEVARARYDPVLQVRRGWRDEADPGRTTASVSQTLPAELDTRFTAIHEEGIANREITTYALRLSKTILGGGTWLEGRLPLDRALIQKAREGNRLSLERRRLDQDVTRKYYDVVRNRLTLRLRMLQVERARRNLEHARVKEDPLDIATAELRVPESELDVLRTRQSIANGLLDLRDEIGMPLSQPLQVNTQLVFKVRDLDVAGDILRALDRHEQILNARLDLELNQKEYQVARPKRYPEVRLEVTVEQEESAVEDESTEARGEVVLEWPWLDRRDRAEIRQRAVSVRESEIRLADTTRDVERTIRSLALRVEEAAQVVTLQRRRVKVLERQQLLYQNRWENGEINILEFIRSQNDLENARVQLVSQQTRYLELLAEYDFAVGR